jgi:hypothetical protein
MPPEQKITELKALYDDARRRKAAASTIAGKLAGALSDADRPEQVTKLSRQISAAHDQADDAQSEADGYGERVENVLEELMHIRSRPRRA